MSQDIHDFLVGVIDALAVLFLAALLAPQFNGLPEWVLRCWFLPFVAIFAAIEQSTEWMQFKVVFFSANGDAMRRSTTTDYRTNDLVHVHFITAQAAGSITA